MKYIQDQEEVYDAILQISAAPYLGFDTETTGLDSKKDTLLLVQVATPENVFVFDARRVDLAEFFEFLKGYQNLVIFQNGKFDLGFVKANFGFWWTGNFYDTMLAHRLKTTGLVRKFEDKFLSLERLCEGYLGEHINKEIRDSFLYVGDDAVTEQQVAYAAKDASVLINLWQAMKHKVLDKQSQKILDLEFALIPITASLEYNGIGFDPKVWNEIADEKIPLRQQAWEEIQNTFASYGIDWEVNLNSWQQLLKAFKIMGYDLPNTQAATIEKYHHKDNVFKNLTEYKYLQKALSTYGHEYPEKYVQDDGRIYAEFNQLGTDTGRFSCSGPNLQQIPIRKDPRYRDAFVAQGDNVLVTSDLSQIEFRLAGELSGEQIIIDEYRKEEPDFHQLTATISSNILGKEIDRFTGKTENFALIYQAEADKLVDVLGCDIYEALDLHTAFWDGYPNLRAYMVSNGADTLVKGYSETAWGRRRYFIIPQGNSFKDEVVRSAIAREGGNMKIQGAAADLLKQGMVYMFPQIDELGAKMVHTIHDEIVIEAKARDAEIVQFIVDNALSQAGAEILSQIPVVTNTKISRQWAK